MKIIIAVIALLLVSTVICLLLPEIIDRIEYTIDCWESLRETIEEYKRKRREK